MSDQGLHYLLTGIPFKNKIKMKKSTRHLLNEKWTCPMNKDGMAHKEKRINYCEKKNVKTTVMILSFQTDMSGQTVQTQIRLLLEEQSDQGLHCLPFCLHHLDSLLYGRATQFKF